MRTCIVVEQNFIGQQTFPFQEWCMPPANHLNAHAVRSIHRKWISAADSFFVEKKTNHITHFPIGHAGKWSSIILNFVLRCYRTDEVLVLLPLHTNKSSPTFVTLLAVSYTHLDVYKRQLLSSSSNRKSDGNQIWRWAEKLESANQNNFSIVVCNSNNSVCDYNHQHNFLNNKK